MENTSTLNVKKIALFVTGILLVVALGIYLGRGDGLKGSFVDPTKESILVPSPSDVKLAKDASGKYVLSWKYAADDLKKTNLEKDNEGDNAPVASFEWEVEGLNGSILWGNGAVTNNFYNPAEVDAPDAHCYVPVVKISDGKNYGSAFTCTSVYLDQVVVDAILDGESPVTLRVWADLGLTDGIPVDDGFGGTFEKTIISKAGTGTYTLPAIPDPKVVDSVGLGDPKNPGTLPTLIGWGWSDETYGPNETNSLFKDKDGYYFGFDWEILDVSDAAKPVSVFKKDIYGNPGTVSVEAGKDSKVETQKAIDANTKSFLVNDPSKKVWVTPFTYVPMEVKFEEGHSYIARVKTYNGKVAADKTTLVASAAKDSPIYKRPISSVALAPDAVDLKMNGDIAYRFTATWKDSHYGPTSFNTKYTSGGKPVFAYAWVVVDTSDSNKVIFEKKISTDPGAEYVKPESKGKGDDPLKAACYVDMVDAAGKTVKAWVCPTGYIDSTVKYVPEHTYVIFVGVDNGIKLTNGVATSKFTIPKLVPVDTTAPELVSATAISKNQVKVVFSETVKVGASAKNDQFTVYVVQPNGTIAEVKLSNWKVDSDGKTVILDMEDQKAGQKYQVAASALVTDLAGNVTKNPSAAVEFGSFVPATVPMLDTLIPAKLSDLITFTYGWDSAKKIQPDSSTTTLQDETGAYKFVYSVIVEESDGSVLWNNMKGTSPFLATPVTGYESCYSTIGGSKLWTCQMGYIPSNVPMVVGKEYTLRVAAYFSDSGSSGYLAKKFTIPTKLVPTDTVAPQVVSAKSLTKNSVEVTFSEKVSVPVGDGQNTFTIRDKNAISLKNYPYLGAGGPGFPVAVNGVTIVLVTDDQKPGEKYSVIANSIIKDTSGNPVDATVNVTEFTGYGVTAAIPPDVAWWGGVNFQTGAPKFLGWYWKDFNYEPNSETTLLTVDGTPVFAYSWEIEDITDKKIIYKKGLNDDVGTLPKQYEDMKEYCFKKLDSVNGSKVWTCSSAYIPTELASKFVLGHSYVFRVMVDNGYITSTPTTSSSFTVEAPLYPDAPTENPKPLDYVNVTLPQKVGDLVKFDLGWNDKTFVPTAKNTYLKNAAGSYKFAYSWSITENTKEGDVVAYQPYWKPLPEYASCMLSATDYSSWTCPYGYIPSDVNLEVGKTYVLSVAMDNGWDYYEQISSKPFTMTALAPAVPVKPLDFVTINFSEGASGDNPVRFEYGWSETVVPSATNTSLKNAKGEPVFAYGWYLYDAADLNGAPVWKKEKGEKFEDLSVLPPGCTSADSAECAPELVKIYAALYKSCFEKIDATSFAWTCAKGYIPSSVVLDSKKQYVMKVLVYNGKDVTEKVASKAFSVAGPVAPAVVPPTMSLKNLSVKKLSDGNIAVTYTVDLAGKWTADEFSSEVRLNGAKTFVARFTEKVKAGVVSYTYEAILLPWEIKSGDTVSVVMGANGLGAGSYLNDGQSVKYEASGTVATAVVGLVTANALPAATVGSPYSAAIVVKDGVAPYKYVLSSGSALPAGLSLDSLTGVVSGTPTSQGDFSFGLSITDSKNAALNATFTLKIVPAPVGGGTVSGGGTTIINNYTTYNPAAPVGGGSGGSVVVTPPLKPVAPVIDSTKFVFPINLADVSRFRDTTYHWAKNYINVLWNAGYVQGYTVVTFGPDDSLTRAQLLKIVMESLRYKLPEKVAFSPCTDVRPDHWHAKYFAVAREKGIIGGYTDGTCKPNKATNRAEALKILYGAIAQMPQIPAVVITPTVPAGFRNIFIDVDEKSWYYPYFANAVSMGWLKGYEDSTIRPDDELSRAQMAKIVVLAMQKLSWVR